MMLYPNLQISVPLHYEKWLPGDDIWVTFVPEEGAESVEFVVAYNQNLEKRILSTNVEPTFPVVVIGLNERTSINETTGELIIKKEYLKNIGNLYGRDIIEGDEPLPPACVSNLTVTQIPLGLKLDWIRADTSLSDVFVQYIERSGGGSNDWERIAVLGPTISTYQDYNLSPNLYYSYRIVTENSFGECESDDEGKVAPESIPRPEEFVAMLPQLSSVQEFELRWSAFSSTPHTGYQLSRKRVGIDQEYIDQAQFSHDTYNYTETDIQPGVQTNYALQHTGAKDQLGAPLYTTITYPYRDKFNSYLTLDYIEWDSRVESWLNGAPEFCFRIFTVDTNNGNQVIEMTSGGNYGFEYPWQGGAKAKTNVDISHNFFNWIPIQWMDLVTVSVVEEDAYLLSATQVIDLVTKYNSLAETFTEFVKIQQTATEETPKHKFKNNDSKDLGRLYIQFHQPPNVHWQAGYGVEIKFSDN